ncbi:gliding motility-associated peptidyl-prolyl isomerase GldI [Tenacibaculum todarodis]|uniref:Peptidyl-prolyl cis-trans isomerase n=1 Tax=Tenacibaculum todarodis TaxID=1850252 RepID=A0A1L3JGS6_9FLAO|nr:gliding motility-associated peptidyl-prolyl isomerase GldI [Tenacibaculum todarodis]APG64348.1 gliding motility-associated peptidyl-prolyl isomerase GldI [Tenacibaculum todarodis]
MKHKTLYFLLIFIIAFSCKEPEARRPKTQTTKNFYKELIAENKQLIKKETELIEHYISQDTINTYKASSTGFWYTYTNKVEGNTPKPKSEDVVAIEYTITDLEGEELYPKQKRTYKIDKEDFIPALEDGIKLMKIGETITFVIPSHRGFGIAGDGNNIEVNQTIKSTLTLIDIKTK